MKVPEHVDTGRVTLTREEIARAKAHGARLAQKIADFQRAGGNYPTRYNPSARPITRTEMCFIGLLGEFGFRKYCGIEVPTDIVIAPEYFDGGRDVVLQNGYRVQVKAASGAEKYSFDKLPWLLSPRRGNTIDPARCDAVALTLPRPDDGIVEMIGFLVVADWQRLKEPFDFDPDHAVGVPGKKLMPMRHLWFAEVWRNEP